MKTRQTKGSGKLRAIVVGSLAAVLAALLAGAPPVAWGQGCQPGWDETFGIPGATPAAYGVWALAGWNDWLIATGRFNQIGSYGMPAITTDGIARWTGSQWERMDGGFNDNPFEGEIEALAVYQNALYGGGHIIKEPGHYGEHYTLVRYVPATDSWVAAGPEATPARVGQLVVHQDQQQLLMYVVGHLSTLQQAFDSAHVVAFNGASYQAVGDGLNGRTLGPAHSPGGYGAVSISEDEAAASDLDPGLYVVGSFASAWDYGGAGGPGVPGTDCIARWYGGSWHSVGGGVIQPDCGLCIPDYLTSITKFNDGSGLAVYVGGMVHELGGVEVNNLARWDGTAWTPVQGATDPTNGVESGGVATMAVHKRALFVAGDFNTAGGNPAEHIARWNGERWKLLNEGMPGPTSVYALQSFDDGRNEEEGASLFVGGYFSNVSDDPGVLLQAINIARWDNCACPGDVNKDGTVDVVDFNLLLASWGPCPPPCPADFNGDGVVDVQDYLILLANWGLCP